VAAARRPFELGIGAFTRIDAALDDGTIVAALLRCVQRLRRGVLFSQSRVEPSRARVAVAPIRVPIYPVCDGVSRHRVVARYGRLSW
jgi:hypothetical protein